MVKDKISYKYDTNIENTWLKILEYFYNADIDL